MYLVEKQLKEKENICTRKLSNVHNIISTFYSFQVCVNCERTLLKEGSLWFIEQLVIR